jgi:hypothetical protein
MAAIPTQLVAVPAVVDRYKPLIIIIRGPVDKGDEKPMKKRFDIRPVISMESFSREVGWMGFPGVSLVNQGLMSLSFTYTWKNETITMNSDRDLELASHVLQEG